MALEVTNKESGLDRLELLKRLQSIDNKIQELSKRKGIIQNRINESKTKTEEAKALLEEKHTELMNSQKEIDKKSLDLKCIEEEMQKSRGKLLQISNNTEYSAALSEIGGREADKSLLEDKILSMMADMENVTAREKDQKREKETLEKEHDEQKVAVESEIAVLDKNIEETKALWQEIAQQIDKESLELYKRLIEKDGEAVVEVSGQACGGCFMQLTPQTLNLVHRKQELIPCLNCGKILCLPEG